MLFFGSITIAFLAGALSVLSPCVLPILPIVLGSAVAAHRLGPIALASGLVLSFTTIGLTIATVGFSIGFSGSGLQMASAVLLVTLGVVLLTPSLQARLSAAAGPAGNWIEHRFGDFAAAGLSGQFMLGLLFGALWSPCAGPTLGAAALMAANGKNLIQVTFIMLAFGLGATAPLLALGAISRATLTRWRGKLTSSSYGAKAILGAILALFGVLVLSGLNRTVEGFLLSHSPSWLLQLTTRY